MCINHYNLTMRNLDSKAVCKHGGCQNYSVKHELCSSHCAGTMHSVFDAPNLHKKAEKKKRKSLFKWKRAKAWLMEED